MIWGGVPYRSIELAQQNKVKGLICDEILDEFEDKLMIKLGIPSARTSVVKIRLLGFLQTVEIPNRLKGITTDPDDDMIIECAVVGGATHIVTGDQKHLLPLGNYQGILIVKPADFLAEFQ
jgi:putative PIN family toxin of toxin-antitoxin system